MAFLPVLGVIGALASAGGAVMGGIAQANNARYQAEVAKNNALTASQNAAYAAHAGQAKAMTEGLKNANQQAMVKASLAANGVDVNSGSAVDVETSEREKGALDQETIINNSQLQVYGYRTQETNFLEQEQADQAQASEAVPGAAIGAVGSLLSNASSFGGKGGGLFSSGA